MGYIEIAKAFSKEVLFAWLVEEVGELGRALIRKRDDAGDPLLEMGDVWNCLHALAFQAGYTPAAVKAAAEYKSKHHKEHELPNNLGKAQTTEISDESIDDHAKRKE